MSHGQILFKVGTSKTKLDEFFIQWSCTFYLSLIKSMVFVRCGSVSFRMKLREVVCVEGLARA